MLDAEIRTMSEEVQAQGLGDRRREGDGVESRNEVRDSREKGSGSGGTGEGRVTGHVPGKGLVPPWTMWSEGDTER